MRDKYPIAYCPVCHWTMLYSDDPREKKNVTVGVAEPDYHGTMMLCGKCKTMLAVIEKPKAAPSRTPNGINGWSPRNTSFHWSYP